VAQLVAQAQVEAQAAALEFAALQAQRLAIRAGDVAIQPVAAEVLAQRQAGAADPLALLPVPGRGQAPAEGQVATLLVRPGQAQAVATQRTAVQAYQRQAGERLQGEVAKIQGEGALAEQLPAVRAG